MSDPKNPDEIDVDWDQALAEWEDKSFSPEVARDTVTDRPGGLAGPASRPLYRPPSTRPKPAPPPTPASLPLDEDDADATLIARIPEELLRRESREDTSARGPSRGGLSQLFSRESTSSAETGPRPPTVKLRSDPPEEVVTSAQSVPSQNDPPSVEPLRRPPRVDPSDAVPDGAFFDPFSDDPPTGRATISGKTTPPSTRRPSSLPPPPSAGPPRSSAEPRARSQQLTIPAAEEVGGLAPLDAGAEGEGALERLTSEAPVEDWVDDNTLTGRLTLPAPAVSDAPPGRSRATTGPAPARESSQPPAGPPSIAPSPPHAPGAYAAAPRAWVDEKPASSWLDDGTRAFVEERAAWLEEEARMLPDKLARARGLLVCSEMVATAGDRARAHALADEARALAPFLSLAHKQARGLMPWPPDPDELLESLDDEIKAMPAGPARVHSVLLAADALFARSDEEGAQKRLEQAMRMGTGDVRAAVARVARGLAKADPASPLLRLPEGPELSPVVEAVAQCLRLRGSERKDTARREPSANESLLRARQAIASGDLATAARSVADLVGAPELAGGALWLAAALGATATASRDDATRWLAQLSDRGDEDARRSLVARALELDQAEVIAGALAHPGAFTSAERLSIAALAGLPLSADDPRIEGAAATAGMLSLACAVVAAATDPSPARASRTAGARDSRALLELGRLLAEDATATRLSEALSALGPDAERVPGLALELAVREGRVIEVSRVVEGWGLAHFLGPERALGPLAAAMVAERGGASMRAREAYRAAYEADPTCEVALRAVAVLDSIDLVAELNGLAEAVGTGLRAALAQIEAVSRGASTLTDAEQARLLGAAHEAAPELPLASFLAERIARRQGDLDEALRWIRARRAHSSDAVESALDSVREALLVADRDPVLATARLRDAQAVRPADVALRDLYERMSNDPPEDRAAWREQRAAEASGDARVLLSLEAAHDYERVGDEEGAFRCGVVAASTDSSLGRVARERAELRTGRVARLADELFAMAKGAADATSRREAYERLAVLDAAARHDTASALLWHRSVLEEVPDHKPSLRYIEHQLIGEGRTDELEPVAAAIARALRGSGPGELTAHAELAVRLRLRTGPGNLEATRDMLDIAVGEVEPTLWSLRTQQAHAQARGDDDALLEVTKRLVERSIRSSETASLLVRAGEASTRLDRLEEARALLSRASVEDPGDVIAWWLLAEARRRAGDARGAAEACEALARGSRVPQHQLLAWYDAGRMWLDEVGDEDRGMVAFEAAAGIDLTFRDVFDRLSRAYASRHMQSELAELLERRIEQVSDPEERLGIEVQRGRVLLSAGEIAGARRAFEAALAERPDDPAALSAFADLCTSQSDWEAAEQALVRLARRLPTPEEQLGVYARLGDLYSHHLLNLARAEVALKEVLKRAPEDTDTKVKLVEVYKRQNDPARAVELQQELLAHARTPEEGRDRAIELANIHERLSRDPRRAEKALELARRDAPQDVVLLRALAEFYARHHQGPAENILLDRAAADARRAIAAGRITAGPFEIVVAAFELRGRTDGAAVARALLAAVEGQTAALRGIGERAFDGKLDDSLAPEALTAAVRALLAKTGETLEAAAPVDLRELRATPILPDAPIARRTLRVALAIGLGGLQLFSSPRLGKLCLPIGSPMAIVLGEALLDDERVAAFLAMRALNLVRTRTAALCRASSTEIAVLVSAWLKTLNPSWEPQGVPASALATASAKMAAPRAADPDVDLLALEVSAALDGRQAALGLAALAWANRVALLALGDPAAALDALAIAGGMPAGAPTDGRERMAWLGRTPEARDLVAFALTDTFVQARGEGP